MRLLILSAILLVASASASASASVSASASAGAALAASVATWTPQALAGAVERQASETNFGELEQFGREALANRPSDLLQRLEHVAWLELDESNYERFKFWNDSLRTQARRLGDTRYVAIADLDLLSSRYETGDVAAGAKVVSIANSSSDWLVRSHAMMLEAFFDVMQDRTAEAIRLLADADRLVIGAKSPADRAEIWDMEGLALAKLHDLDGSAIAFGRARFEFGRPGYPRPDFDSIWNLASLAARIGRADLATTLFTAEHRLAVRSKIASVLAWDASLCAEVAESLDDQKGVLRCVRPLGADLKDARVLAPLVLPRRAIAFARLGQLKAARRDLAKLERLQQQMRAASPSAVEQIPKVRAEILHAEGRDREAFNTLRSYSLAHQISQAAGVSRGVGQLTGLMAKQLSYRESQLDMAKRNLLLSDRMVRDQRLFGGVEALFSCAFLGLLAWQWRVSRALRSARSEAEAGSRAKGEFLANMSHEIRTPLNGLLTMAEVMDREPLSPAQSGRLAIVRQSGRDLLHLINDILDFSKIEAGKLELEEVVFETESLVQSTLAGFSASAQAKGVAVNLDIRPSAKGMRRGDPARIRQILANYISNALKFTPSGRVDITIEGFGPDGLQIAVADTGPGISVDNISLLFQKFSQVDASTTRRYGGTGLGLAICQELATAMGGRVWVESIEGKGATFFATLMAPYIGKSPEKLDCEQDPTESEMDGHQLRILAAEDNPTNRLVLSTVMQIFGFDLIMVEDGAQAVEAWRTQAFDAILMDIQMPIMDGIQATRAIRALEAQEGRARTPIIALSANAYTHQIREYLAVGMDGHVAKPIELSVLHDALQSVLDGAPVAEAAMAG